MTEETPVVSAMKDLEKLRREHRAIEREIAKATRAAYPVGSQFAYQHGDHTRIAVVVEHGRGDELRVEGVTGSRYWIDVWRAFQ